MIALATSPWLREVMQNRAAASLLATRFVTGDSADESARVALNLPARGIDASLFYLGEYVQDSARVEEAVHAKMAAGRALRGLGLDVHVSVDPTQIGASLDPGLCRRNALRIAATIGEATRGARGRSCLMLDMEDHEVVDLTIAVHDEILAAGHPVAITLQAYLRRTRHDLEAKIGQGAFVRLVKGAFAASADIAYTSRREIRHRYLELAEMALSSRARTEGLYPSFATHDERLQAQIVRLVETAGGGPGRCEFEMLYGVRDDLADRLARAGHRVRLYMPFGTDWWPYALRRVGESPGSVFMLARAFLARRRSADGRQREDIRRGKEKGQGG